MSFSRLHEMPASTDELVRRAAAHLNQRVLVVDYSRIRRRIAYPLQLESLPLPELEVRGLPVYPWSIWYAWALEERIFSLGHAAQRTGKAEYSRAAARDLKALAQWPRYTQFEFPDLCLGHTARVLHVAHARWRWLAPELKSQIETACARLMETALPLHDAHFHSSLSAPLSREAILRDETPHRRAHNVAFIGSIGIALAAHVAQNEEVLARLNADIQVLVAWLLELREEGFSEGASYDGHVLDLIADWLAILPEAERKTILNDARWNTYFQESVHLGAPGALTAVAPLSDVEPHNTMHVSAQIKMHVLQSTLHPREQAARAWYLQNVEVSRLRADAVAALETLPQIGEIQMPDSKIGDAHYALVLRSGWETSDVAVAVAASNSPMNHVAANYGSLCIGTQGEWFIQAPGYQQYMPGSEREFTIGKTSRNTPLLGGFDASVKDGRVLRRENGEDSASIELDLTRCYAREANLQAVTRRVTLRANAVLIEDFIAPHEVRVEYFWHGAPDVAWWIEDGSAQLFWKERALRIVSPQAHIQNAHLQRLRGSRGQMTLAVSATPEVFSEKLARVQWFFCFHDSSTEAFASTRIVSNVQNFKSGVS